jgi:inosine-uridine nucleoside N-ribohydrolase
MKRLLFVCICIFIASNFVVNSTNEESKKKIPVIFDTDLGNDVDDIMALKMLYNYENKGFINLIGITISKSNLYAVKYVDGYNRFNNKVHIPLGYVYEGPNKDDGKYLRQTLDTVIDGRKILVPELSLSSHLLKGYILQRKLLSEQHDSSVIFIVVGPATNIQRLLESDPDKYSNLNGIELIRKKVKLLSVMGGNFEFSKSDHPEWNVLQDIHSSQIMFSKWPTKIVASGFEVGIQLRFPHERIFSDFPNPIKNPLCVSYKLYGKMPYDNPLWDLTAVLYAIEPEKNYFDLSHSGIIRIDEKGNSRFTPLNNGKHYFLVLKKDKIPVVLDSLIRKVTDKF